MKPIDSAMIHKVSRCPREYYYYQLPESERDPLSIYDLGEWPPNTFDFYSNHCDSWIQVLTMGTALARFIMEAV